MDDHLSRAAARNPVRFELNSLHNFASRELVRVFDKAMKGQIPKDDVPCYSLGVKVGLAIWDRTAPVPKAGEGERGPITINVAIVTSEAGGAGHAAQANGVAIRFSGGDGDGT